jgi:hypothetical protein
MTMTDRELLEAAAKAAGIELGWDARGAHEIIPGISGNEAVWSPLDDDAQAFRLAVKLHLEIDIGVMLTGINGLLDNQKDLASEIHGDDPAAATRRAIVRAAASLSQEKQPHG